MEVKYKLVKRFPTLPKDWTVGMELTVKTFNNIKGVYTPYGYTFKYIEVCDVENNPKYFKKVGKSNLIDKLIFFFGSVGIIK